jgi:CRISPR/Cas system CSM-associated protein Csm4 (group 5 of RAMP superfamily)
MPTNPNKGTAYQLVLSKMKSCAESDDVFHLIGLIASCESIMSDRLSAYLGGTKNEKHKQAIERKKFVSVGELLKFIKKELKGKIEIKQKVGGIITIENLHSELKAWIKKRNQVIHAVCKSRNTESHKDLESMLSESKSTCVAGHRLVAFLLKWSKQTKAQHKKLLNSK